MKKEKFEIQGMTCSSCQAHVERAVKKLEGVNSVVVNLLSNNMVVEFDENKLSNESIINAVIDAGYGVTQLNQNSNAKENSENTYKKEINESIKKMKKRLILSFVFLIPLMYIAMHHMLGKALVPDFISNIFDGAENALVFAISQLILLIPIIILNKNYFTNGFKRLFKGAPNMDSLIAIGSSAATVYGFFAIYMIVMGLKNGDINQVETYMHDIYFESAGTILTLITLGKYLETKSKGKTNEAITKLINLVPKTAFVHRDGKEIEVEVNEIKENEIVLIKPGSNIPVDGIIIQGESALDESSITGESIPVDKGVGEKVISGTVNKNGFLKIKATKVGENTTISQIVKLVEEASNSKAPISKLADKVSGIFVPAVIIIAIITTLVWLLVGQPFEFALSTGIAVLVISCPCALGLAVPVAIMVGTGKGAEKGILIKSAESLEMLHLIDTVVLDKTGTITEGKPKVVDIIAFDEDKQKLLKIASSIEKNSEHPLASAIVENAIEEGVISLDIKDFKAVSGRGVEATIADEKFFGGNLAFMNENKVDLKVLNSQNEEYEKQGKTVLYFAKENQLLGFVVVADTIKESSKEAIEAFKDMNLEIAMLTGDNKAVANSIAKELGITNVFAEVLPQDKERIVREFQEKGKKVAFVGDGINDSPALVRADIGIAIGQGTDIAIESADIVLIKNSLTDVVTALELGKAVMRKIRQNLFWAFFYNIIGIPIAAGVLYPIWQIKLNPMIGAAAMSFSSVTVVTNALLLRKFISKYTEKDINEEKKCDKSCEILERKEEKSIMRKVIIIEGMHCNHCKMAVEKVLKKFENVVNAEVDLEKKTATVEYEGVLENERITEVITEEGFEVVKIEE